MGTLNLEAELKAVLSGRVRLPAHLLCSGALDPATAQTVWRKFTRPFREQQLSEERVSTVLVDVSLCEELSIFLSQKRVPRGIHREHANTLRRQVAERAVPRWDRTRSSSYAPSIRRPWS